MHKYPYKSPLKKSLGEEDEEEVGIYQASGVGCFVGLMVVVVHFAKGAVPTTGRTLNLLLVEEETEKEVATDALNGMGQGEKESRGSILSSGDADGETWDLSELAFQCVDDLDYR